MSEESDGARGRAGCPGVGERRWIRSVRFGPHPRLGGRRGAWPVRSRARRRWSSRSNTSRGPTASHGRKRQGSSTTPGGCCADSAADFHRAARRDARHESAGRRRVQRMAGELRRRRGDAILLRSGQAASCPRVQRRQMQTSALLRPLSEGARARCGAALLRARPARDRAGQEDRDVRQLVRRPRKPLDIAIDESFVYWIENPEAASSGAPRSRRPALLSARVSFWRAASAAPRGSPSTLRACTGSLRPRRPARRSYRAAAGAPGESVAISASRPRPERRRSLRRR